ncbi:hypothetical protein DFH11DRAFT_1633636 [Phellopilus nigrolimitatus]|nr:hypothetical protein DFH11DRAFT_1633636 [Phellopilus nigrolimitatus]
MSSQASKLALCFASSRVSNRRNLEGHWYSYWNYVLNERFGPNQEIIFGAQYPIHRPSPSEVEVARDMSQRVFQDQAAEAQYNITNYSSDAGEDTDVYNDKSHNTYVITDFAGFHIRSREHINEHVNDGLKYHGLDLLEPKLIFLIENKRAPSRYRLTNPTIYWNEIISYIKAAQVQVLKQACYAFCQDPKLPAIVVIAASGDFWKFTTVHRAPNVLTPKEHGYVDNGTYPPVNLGIAGGWTQLVGSEDANLERTWGDCMAAIAEVTEAALQATAPYLGE